MQTRPTRQQLKQFAFGYDHPPLHILPIPSSANDTYQQIPVAKYIDAKTTREFFGVIEEYKRKGKIGMITHEWILDSGQTVGRCSMCYACTLHSRRQGGSSNERSATEAINE